MKRQIGLIAILVLLFAGMIFGVVYLNNPDIFKSSKKALSSSVPTTQVYYPVIKGEVVHTYEINTRVVSGAPSVYMEEIKVVNVTDSNFEILKAKGDTVSPSDPIYMYDGEVVSVDFNALIVDITSDQTYPAKNILITLLNYDSLYTIAQIDTNKYKKINYDTNVKVIYEGREYESKILTIGWEVSQGKIPVKVDIPINILPGTDVKVVFILEVQNMAFYTLEEAIYQDGGRYYANVLDGPTGSSKTRRVEVTVGQRFSVEENGKMWDYVELLSGVKEGDTIVVEIIDNMGNAIREKLQNG